MPTQDNLDNSLNKSVVHSVDALRTLLSEITLLDTMKMYNFYTGSRDVTDVTVLKSVPNEGCINSSFSKVKLKDVGPYVGLDPKVDFKLEGMKTFSLHRSRIPTALLKSIAKDMDVMLLQYGPPAEQRTEAARSRFLSPIFNRLVAVFGFAFRNLPESTFKGHISTKGRVEYYFKTRDISVLIVEMKLKIYKDFASVSSIIAQVIAECDGCDLNNSQQGFRLPVHAILCNGDVFEFFLFDSTTEPFTFKRGILGDPSHPTFQPRHAFGLPDPTEETSTSTRSFLDALRPICEVIFDLLLRCHVLSLKSYHNHYVNNTGLGGDQLEKWEEAITFAVRALEGFRLAEMKRKSCLIDEANLQVEEAMGSLKSSIDAIPNLAKPKTIMSDWDDEKIEKV